MEHPEVNEVVLSGGDPLLQNNARLAKLLKIIEERTDYKPNVDTLYIHPNPHDYEMFFADHFSLSPKILSKIVQTGFRSAINEPRARRYD